MPTARQTPWRWARAQEHFDTTAARVIFYDSEFVREKSYYPKLSLVQWQSADSECAVLCDPMNAEPPWQALLHHPAPLIMHSGSQDLELMRQQTQCLPRSVRDTQIGFALCHPQLTVSFAALIEHYLGVNADKSATRSDWLQRPLDNEQLNYAANDVGLLSRVYPLLCAELLEKGRLAWWAEECQHLLAQQAMAQLRQPWYKLRHAPQLRGRATAIAALLHNVREDIAAEQDLPRRQILDDSVIIKMAQDNIRCSDELAEYIDPEHILFSRQAELDAGFAAIDKPYPVIPRSPRLNAAQRHFLQRLSDRCHEVAESLTIHTDLISTQKNLRYFAAGDISDCRIDQGWRRQFFSDLL